MKLVKSDLFQSSADVILVTANSYVNKQGELVMGRGAALELKTMYPVLASKFGMTILAYAGHLGEYNVLITYPYSMTSVEEAEAGQKFGIFQVKYHFRDKADLGLIDRSVQRLIWMARLDTYKDRQIAMNFPGIGFGGLKVSDVLPIIEKLPDNVTVHTF